MYRADTSSSPVLERRGREEVKWAKDRQRLRVREEHCPHASSSESPAVKTLIEG